MMAPQARVSLIVLGCMLVRAAATIEPLRINGLVAAVYSPFSSDHRLNTSVVPAQHAYLSRTGVEWVFVGGTTGESVSLRLSEREALVEAWLSVTKNVIVHVGTDCLDDAVRLAEHAAGAGAAAIASMPPVFFSPANARALALTVAKVCAGAPKLPCYYYHIPSMTHYTGPMLGLVEEIERIKVPNFVGVKYTGLYNAPGYMDVQRLLARGYEVFGGREEMMLESLAVGIVGHVGSQFNFAGDLFNKIREGYASAGLTSESAPRLRALQLRAVDMIAAWQDPSPPGVNGHKYWTSRNLVPVGDARLPALPVDDDAARALDASLDEFCADGDGVGGSLVLCS